jgi:hypothetical protein
MRTLTAVLVSVVAFAAPAAAQAGDGDLASNAGCSANCIRTALVYPSSSGMAVRVQTNTTARIKVVLYKRSTMQVVAERTSIGMHKQFVTYAGGLDEDTLYLVSVTATDAAGQVNRRSRSMRTLDRQSLGDGLDVGDVASGAGCAAQCIRTAQVSAGLRAAKITVNTNVPARLMISADPSEPLATSQGPSFAHPDVSLTTSQLSTQWSGELLGLVASRRYNVIIRAIDANGRMSVRQGTFETAKRHAIVTFKRIRVSYDGDKGANRGELAFHGKINGYWRVKRKESKVKSDSTVHFPNGGTVGYTDLTRWIDLKVQAVEHDAKGTCYDSLGSGPFSQKLSGSINEKCHKRTWNTAVGEFDLDEIFAQDGLLPGFGGWSSFDKTIYAERGPIRFKVDVGFEVWSE